jgi:hypothetical protein
MMHDLSGQGGSDLGGVEGPSGATNDMAIWEYKVISSGKGGFASPQLLENFLNELGTDEWEIIDYRAAPDNPLAFTGLARRGSQRDWTLEAEAAAQARDEERRKREEEHRKEEARIEKAAAEAAAEREAAIADKESGGDGLRAIRDTERDDDPEALADEADGLEDWDELDLEDDLPTLLDAVKPHLRRNQKGIGEAAAVDYLAKRWDQEPADVLGALEECGFEVPESEDDDPVYFDFEGDLFWLNRNNRGQLFLNVREKPRPRFKTAKGKKLAEDDPAAEDVRSEHQAERAKRKQVEEERAARKAAREAEAAKPADPLPAGMALLDLIKTKMRRNRRGPGMSGSVSFLSKAFKHDSETLIEALQAIGLSAADDKDAKPNFVEHGDDLFWMKQDGRGGAWINCREKDKDKAKSNSADSEDVDPSAEPKKSEDAPGEKITFAPGPNAIPSLRLLLKPKSRGTGVSAELGTLADALKKPAVEILEVLVNAGLNVPESAEEKPNFIELGSEILWLNRNAKDDALWLNAKPKPKRKTTTKKAATKKTTAKKTTAKKAARKEADSAGAESTEE